MADFVECMGKPHTEIEHRHCGVPAAASRTVVVGMVVNGILILLKFAAGIVGRSSAMVADAVHSLSDFLTDIVVLVSLKISRRPPDQSHDYGHEKFETLATAIVGVVVFFAGVKILYSAGKKIFALIASGESSFPGPTGVALAAAVISIGLKEGIFRYTIAVGRRIGSS
ncbi:MAG TPA: cation diffusion facilitator family transporter, partial [candidate division Zixibacteria bacterium]|nr:cation diffusion facilitator family transporter [candidate division Zixibacteria bacterium]